MTIDLSPRWRVVEGDCLAVMPTLPDACVDAVVTDPPYGLAFMGKAWDHGVPGVPFWAEALRVVKPGAHLLAFGGTRTFHRLTCAIEDAGWEIRDCLSWLYGSGFPKSHNGPWGGTALKPAWEPVVLARKPLIGTVAANHAAHGTGALNVDGCRIDATGRPAREVAGVPGATGCYGEYAERGSRAVGSTDLGRWPANVVLEIWHDPVLRLRYDAPQAVAEFYDGCGAVQGVRVPDPDLPEPREADAVLRESVLREGAQSARKGSAPDVRQEALPDIAGEDASEQEGQPERPARPDVGRGSARRTRLRHGERGPADAAGASPVRADGEQVEQPVCAGASLGHGSAVGASAAPERGRASSERREVGQPTAELGTVGQRDTQAGPRCDPAGTAARATGERGATRAAVEVRESDVPRAWLRYFDRTGDAIRCGSAGMLDEQSGERASGYMGADQERKATLGGGGYQGGFGSIATHAGTYGDSGGASRFFYTAKASRSEREAGLSGHATAQRDETRNPAAPGGNNPRNRGAQQVRNTHPTVKPVDLMRWLVRIVTTAGGLVLDPFTGSGTTGIAAHLEGCRFLGIEREPAYVAIARARIAAEAAQGTLALGGGA